MPDFEPSPGITQESAAFAQRVLCDVANAVIAGDMGAATDILAKVADIPSGDSILFALGIVKTAFAIATAATVHGGATPEQLKAITSIIEAQTRVVKIAQAAAIQPSIVWEN